MKCKNHPDREAEHFCASCGIPICASCTEEPSPGQFFCFQCAMLQTVSFVGTSLTNKREKATEKKLKKKKEWGPFQYFVIISSVLIAVMWGVIIFGGQKVSGSNIDFGSNSRVFLFMVDSSIKRYIHYEGGKYPEKIEDIIPKYLSLGEEELVHLNMLSYKLDPVEGYLLSFAKPKPSEMNIIISTKSIKYETISSADMQNE